MKKTKKEEVKEEVKEDVNEGEQEGEEEGEKERSEPVRLYITRAKSVNFVFSECKCVNKPRA
jgi:flagellar biosynthesis/type III secretory pathway protein FliH